MKFKSSIRKRKVAKPLPAPSQQPIAPPSQPWKPHAYQRKSVMFLMEHAAAGLFLDPGLGKTSITLAAIKILKNEKVLRRCLVIAPLRVMNRVWPVERESWTDFHSLSLEILHGKDKAKVALRDADVYVINPDGLPWLVESGAFRRLGFDTLVVDEGRRFRKPNTQTFKLIRPLLPTFKRRWLLTGSPNPNGYLDLFGQMYVLDLGRSLGPYISHYRLEYFYPSGYLGYDWTIKPGAEKRIQKRIKPLVLRMEAEDYIKMPAVVENNIRVDLPEEARRVYDELENEMLTILEGRKIVTALNAAAASAKCAQVADGGLYHMPTGNMVNNLEENFNGRKWTDLHMAKIEAMEEILDEINNVPTLVAYDFEHDLDRLKKAFPKAEYLGGGLSPKDEKAVEERWNRGEIALLFGHPASIAHGLNLQTSGCRHVIFHSIPWDFELYDQFIRRVRRQGNKHADVMVYRIIARDTVDEAKVAALSRKHKTQKGLLDSLKTYVSNRKRS